jgi:hypothetical protein
MPREPPDSMKKTRGGEVAETVTPSHLGQSSGNAMNILTHVDEAMSPDAFGGRHPHYIYSLRSFLPRSDWNLLRHAVYAAARNRCGRCGGSKAGARPWPLEAHEIWDYLDAAKNHQRLVGLAALCPDCHAKEHRTKDPRAGRIGIAHADFLVVTGVHHDEDDPSRVTGNYIEVDWDALSSKYGISLTRTGQEIVQLFRAGTPKKDRQFLSPP